MPAQSFCFSLTIAVFGIRGLFNCPLSQLANIFVSLEVLKWALQVVQVMPGGPRLVTISLIIFVLFLCMWTLKIEEVRLFDWVGQ